MILASRLAKSTSVMCFALVIASACSGTEMPTPELASTVVSSCPSPDDAEYWLPKSAVLAGRDFDRTVELIAPALEAAGESPLWCGNSSVEEYRAILIPANRPAIVARVRLASEAAESIGVVFADPRTVINPPGSSLPPRGNRWTVKTKARGRPTDQQVRELRAAITDGEYWTIPAWRHEPDTMDGTVWYLEGRRRNSYRVVIRDRFPDPTVEGIAKRLIELVELDVETQ
jgi:hypothetical protein